MADWHWERSSAAAGAALSRSLGKGYGTSPPAPAGAASGPTHNQCNQCVLLTVCQILLLSCIFSPSHHSSYSSTQIATSSEHLKSQGDSNTGFVISLYFPPPSPLASFIQCLQTLCWGRGRQSKALLQSQASWHLRGSPQSSKHTRKASGTACGLPAAPKPGLKKPAGTPGKKTPPL